MWSAKLDGLKRTQGFTFRLVVWIVTLIDWTTCHILASATMELIPCHHEWDLNKAQ